MGVQIKTLKWEGYGYLLESGITRVTRKRVLEGTQDNAFDSRPAATPDLSESSVC